MSLKKLSVLLGILVVASMVLTACPAPQPQVVEKVVTQVVTQVQTQVVEKVSTQVVEKKVEVEKVVTQQVEKIVEKSKEDFTTPHPILSDVRVRQAIAHCSNRDELIASVYPFVDDETKAKLRMDSWIPKTSWAYGGPYQDYEFSPEKGGALLDEAGWKLPEGESIRVNDKGEPLALKFTTTNAQFRQTWSAVFVQQMAACGIQILPQYTPASWWFGDTTGLARRDYELGAYAWVGEPDPGGRTLYACDQIPLPSNNWEGQNTMGWCNKAASDAIVKANNTLIKDERKAAYNIVQEEFVKDMPSLPVFQRVEGEAWNPKLTGLKVDPTEYTTANIAEWSLEGGDTAVLGMSQEPASMYDLVEQAAAQIVVAFIGGNTRTYTKWNYDYHPNLQDPLSTIESGLTKNNTVDVKAGDMVYDTSGKPVKLDKGVKVFDADGKEVEYDGSSPLKMKQLVITYKFKDYTWSDGVKGTVDDIALGIKNDCDKDSGATSFIFCDAMLDKQFATDKLETTITMVPGYQDPLYMTYGAPFHVYPAHQKLSDGRMLKDVPAKEWATLPEIAEKPLSWGPFQLTDWKKGQSMTFEANQYANPAPKLKKVVVQFFPDTQTAVAALLGGDVDWLEKSTLGAGAEVQTVLDAAKEGKVKVELGPNPTWEHIDMNLYTK
jgi:ABC-type transport system substrate-binding protein